MQFRTANTLYLALCKALGAMTSFTFPPDASQAFKRAEGIADNPMSDINLADVHMTDALNILRQAIIAHVRHEFELGGVRIKELAGEPAEVAHAFLTALKELGFDVKTAEVNPEYVSEAASNIKGFDVMYTKGKPKQQVKQLVVVPVVSKPVSQPIAPAKPTQTVRPLVPKPVEQKPLVAVQEATQPVRLVFNTRPLVKNPEPKPEPPKGTVVKPIPLSDEQKQGIEQLKRQRRRQEKARLAEERRQDIIRRTKEARPWELDRFGRLLQGAARVSRLQRILREQAEKSAIIAATPEPTFKCGGCNQQKIFAGSKDIPGINGKRCRECVPGAEQWIVNITAPTKGMTSRQARRYSRCGQR